MESLFKPAVSVANRMSFSSKLTFVVLIFLLPFLLLLILQLTEHQRGVTAAENIERGVSLALDIKPIALELAKHRGTVSQYLNGATEKEGAVRTIEKDIDQKFQRLLERLKLFEGLEAGVNRIVQSWESLKLGGSSMGADASFVAHTELIEETHQYLAEVADHFDVELSSTRDQYYLTQLVFFENPELQELLGQLRGKGAGALIDKKITIDEQASLSGLRYGVQRVLGNVKQEFLMLNANPEIRKNLSVSFEEFEVKLRAMDLLLAQQVIGAKYVTLDHSQFFNQLSSVIESVGLFDSHVSEMLLQKVEQVKADELHSMWLLLTISSLSVTLGCYFAIGILRALNNSVEQINVAAQYFKSGDFSHKILVHSRDVIGDVAGHLRAMVQQVSGLIVSIQSAAGDVNKLSIEIQSVTDLTKNELDHQNNQTQQSASAATEMAATVREVARTCVDTSSATDIARDIAREGQQRVNQAIQMINRLGNDVTQAKDIIGQLQHDVTDISAVLEVIRSIAEQTNLLALNAAIEAARAGEQGRGFAVVADEVRSLAKRTQDSTAEIKTVIEKLQARAATAVNIILQSFHSSQESVQSAASAGDSLQQIVQNVEMLRDLNTQIATAAEEQAAVAEQMSRSTRELGDSAENILGQVEQTLGFSVTMRRSASQLLENTLQFKT